jgi:hypothetical protein
MWRYAELVAGKQGQTTERVVCYDNSLVYAFTVTRQGSKDKWGTVQLQNPRAQPNLHPDYLLGLQLSNVNRSIVDVLRMGEVTKSDLLLPAGTRGVRLLAHAVPSAEPGPKQLKYDVAITIDPKHDFLAQEIVVTESAANISWHGWEQRWTIVEYRQFVDERTSRHRWFPVLGILTQGKTKAQPIQIKVGAVRINQSLPLTLFHPQIPDGTTVADNTSDGRGQLAIKGGKYAIAKRIKDLTDEARLASGSPFNGLFILLTIVAIVALVLGFAFVWRKRIRLSHSVSALTKG